ncbi:hypothetical protein Fcan01_16161, partial [Folsomia candida]
PDANDYRSEDEDDDKEKDEIPKVAPAIVENRHVTREKMKELIRDFKSPFSTLSPQEMQHKPNKIPFQPTDTLESYEIAVRSAATYVSEQTVNRYYEQVVLAHNFGEILDGLQANFNMEKRTRRLNIKWPDYLAGLKVTSVGVPSLKKYVSFFRLCKAYPRLLRVKKTYSYLSSNVKLIRRAIEVCGERDFFMHV